MRNKGVPKGTEMINGLGRYRAVKVMLKKAHIGNRGGTGCTHSQRARANKCVLCCCRVPVHRTALGAGESI